MGALLDLIVDIAAANDASGARRMAGEAAKDLDVEGYIQSWSPAAEASPTARVGC